MAVLDACVAELYSEIFKGCGTCTVYMVVAGILPRVVSITNTVSAASTENAFRWGRCHPNNILMETPANNR